jgi:signal transduction histidine kinase
MEKHNEKKQSTEPGFFETDAMASNLVNEMYVLLKNKTLSDISAEQLNWVKKVEALYAKHPSFQASILYSFLDSAYQYLTRQVQIQWEERDEKVYELIEKIISLKSEGIFKNLMEGMNKAVHSTLSLDFTAKAPISNENLNERNILNYIPFALNMIIEKMETSVVSMKAVNTMLAVSPGSALIVADRMGTIRFVNKIGESLFEIKHNQYQGHSTRELFQEHEQIIKKLHGSKSEIKKMKVHLLLKQGKIPVYVDVFKASADDEIEEIIFCIHQRDTIENQTDTLFDLTQESHDKIAPLNSISGIINLLMPMVTDEDSKQLILFLDDIVMRMKKNTRETLMAIGTEKENQKKDLVNIEFIFDSIVKSLAFTEGFGEITFIKDIHYQTDFISDRRLIYSILQNLISNAIKYRKVGFQNRVQLTVRETVPNKLLLIILDTGIGISRENQQNIFKKNYREAFNIEGQGLGLYLIKESVSKLGGEIEVISTLGEGSAFILSLPS